MSPQHGMDFQRMTLESDPESSELLDLDSDTCSQGSQAALSGVGGGGYCDGCEQFLLPDEVSLEAGGRRWHRGCLCCSMCACQLQQRCFITRTGHLLCVDDFNRLYNTCRRCGLQFSSPWELAIVAPTSPPLRFHPDCFSCAVCQRHMRKHDLFAAAHGDVFCAAHAHGLSSLPPPPDQVNDPTLFPPGHPGRPGRGRRRGRKPGSRSGDLGDVRRKRHRIQFSIHQLQDLQTAFSSNPNPDSKTICDLANRLTLGKQHVQVWFQNRRAKERRVKSDSPHSDS